MLMAGRWAGCRPLAAADGRPLPARGGAPCFGLPRLGVDDRSAPALGAACRSAMDEAATSPWWRADGCGRL